MNAEGAIAPAGRVPARREDRAALAFVVLAMFVAVIGLVVAIGASQVHPLRFALAMAAPLLSLFVLLAAAFGLSRRRDWAVAVCTPMLAILVVAGVISFFVALLQARLEIPLGALVAWWAFRAAPEPRPVQPRAGLAGSLLVGGLLLFNVLPLLTPVALVPGGAFIVGASDLDHSMTVDCGPTAASAATGPEAIVVTYHWAWRRVELLAGGPDQATVSWFANGGAGSDGYVLVETEHEPGVTEANRMLDGAGGVVFAIDLATKRFAPGQVRVTLQRTLDTASEHGSIEMRARYVHGPTDIYNPTSAGLWDTRTDARCEW
jgi:hypothetical protein